MPRPTAAEIRAELNTIEALVASFPDGVSRRELELAMEGQGSAAWRTLLRRLQRLIEENRVSVKGRGKRAVYVLGPASDKGREPPLEEDYVPMSRTSWHTRSLVRRPIAERKPVTYDNAFLEKYQPGSTWYLDRSLRERLHDAGRTPDANRPAGTYARDIYERLLIDLSWASSRLEGNTYSRLDTKNLLEFGQRAEGKDASEAQMILNHKAAVDILVSQAEELGFNVFTFRNLHAALSENLLDDPSDEGRIRTRIVQISGTTYVPLSIPQKIEEHFRTILEKVAAIPDPFEQSFFIMVHIPYLQPFDDVNKRTSRLGANISLVKANLCPLSFVDVPERAYVDGMIGVYETTRIDLLRDVFMFAYERSAAQYKVVRESLGEPDPTRLRYRAQLTEVVHHVVKAGQAPNASFLKRWAREHEIDPQHIDSFAERARELLVDLHEGALVRYRLRPSELAAWKAAVARRGSHGTT